MEFVLLGAVPLLFLLLAAGMMVVSQVAGHFTFSRMSSRQRASNQILAGFIARMRVAQMQLARRSAQLTELSGRLSYSNQELERLNNLKSKFLSMAVHDVRTPMATIRGYAELMEMNGELNDKQKKCLKGIFVAGEQINRLMGDLTDLAIIEAGKMKMDKVPFRVSELLGEIGSTFAPIASKNRLLLEVEDATEGAFVTGDRFRIGQVASNFVGNALKFTPAGGRVELKAAAGAGGVLFSVTDTGAGIHPSERRKVFEKFYQSKHSTLKSGRAGWGLGLSIAQEIVRAHSGDIGVESAGLGRGSKFWFFVPADPRSRPVGRGAVQAVLALASALLVLVSLPGAGRAQTLPLEDKARYDKFLEEKAESVLLKVLGPNRAKVVVDATVDFTRIERFRITMAKGRDESKEGATTGFAWQNVAAQQAGAVDLLPGVPVPKEGMGIPQSYERESGFAPSFVKRLAVTILLDRSVPVAQGDSLQTIVSDLLEIDPNRGDSLTLVRTDFVPAWRALWYSPDSFSMVFRYTVLALMTLITLVVVASCFLRLANAMDSMARAQSSQYSMDLTGGGEGGGEGGEIRALAAPKGDGEGPGSDDKRVEEEVVIEVGADQLDALTGILEGQDPENVALVLAHLQPERRRAYLARRAPAAAAELVARLGRVRFLEPGLMASIKEELERRLAGAVGGVAHALRVLEDAEPAAKREILKSLELSDPGLALEVRKHVLLMDDLFKLNAEDWALLLGRVSLETWCRALRDAPEGLDDALRAQMLPKTWAILEQTLMAAPPTTEQSAAAQGVILDELSKLAAAGQIRGLSEAPPSEPAPVETIGEAV